MLTSSQTFSFEAIGTKWEIDLSFDKKKEPILLDTIKKRVEEFDYSYSRFRTDSLISQIAKSGGIYDMPSDFHLLYEVYATLFKVSNGLFTPLIGNTLDSLGYDATYSLTSKTPVLPQSFSETVSFKDNKLITKRPVLLDFGAGGKGYLVDIIGKILIESEVSDFIINAGGDILHSSAAGNKVRIGLENPQNLSQVIGVVEIANMSLCASAGNRRKWGNHHHIVNPKTLVSPQNVIGVWVIAESALIADSMTTVLYLDPQIKNKLPYPCEYFILYSDMTFDKSENFDAELFLR